MGERDDTSGTGTGADARPAEAREWLVTGRVQGVGFRAAVRRRALELGVHGVAENLPDGRVRVVGTGAAAALDALGEWLRHGPPAARVEALDERDAEPGATATGGPGFATR